MIEPIISGEGRISPYERYRQYQQYIRPGKGEGEGSAWGAQGKVAVPERTNVANQAAAPEKAVVHGQIAKPGQVGMAAQANAPTHATAPGRVQENGKDVAPGQIFAEEAAAPDVLRASSTGSNNVAPATHRECQTCKSRRYQDQSNDSGVSYQTPTKISPEKAASAVRAHENEHVTREQAKAKQKGREVVSQSVVLKTAICPECGKVYISGGTTTTVTRAKDKENPFQVVNAGDNQGNYFDKNI